MGPRKPPHCPVRPGCAGLTLIEVVVVLTILVLALGEISRSLLTVSGLEPTNRETGVALDAATAVIEALRAEDFEDVFVSYDDLPDNDPNGPGSAPGAGFAVPGLDLLEDDADGLAGRVVFPVTGIELREDVADAALGMPRDLDGDDVVDALDHSASYDILPVRVRVEWRGAGGPRFLELVTTLGGRE